MDTPYFAIAQRALVHYGLENATLVFLAQTHHVVYQVNLGGVSTVLRIYTQRPHDLETEIEWLNMLAPVMTVPQPIPTRYHTPSAQVDDVSVVLFMYLHGQSIQPRDLTADLIYKMGQFLARLHQSDMITRVDVRRLDYEGLFGEAGLYPFTDVNPWLNAEQNALVMQFLAQFRQFLAEHEMEQRMLHGDFLLSNILVHDDSIRAIDFEYCGVGYPLYDLAPLLWQLKPQANYDALAQAYWAGYTENRPTIQADHAWLEWFITARHVASIRWVALNQDNPMIYPHATRIIAQRVAELAQFLDNGILRRTAFLP